VAYLEAQVAFSNPSNVSFQQHPLGNLVAGSSASQLQKLVDKWFLGQDHPQAAASYQAVSGTLFGTGGPKYTDVAQGQEGDCVLLASLAITAARDSADIQGMFTDDGNNVWTVRFYQNGAPVYVTVDNLLPGGGNTYDQVQNGVLWVALAEKAYAELNTFATQTGVDPSMLGWTSYAALNGLEASQVLQTLTNRAGNATFDAGTIDQALARGNLIVLGTDSNPADWALIGDHAYAVLGYDPATAKYILFNPWGVNGGILDGSFKPGIVEESAAFIKANFTDDGGWVRTAPTQRGIDVGLLAQIFTQEQMNGRHH
jgi:hypothetical protein